MSSILNTGRLTVQRSLHESYSRLGQAVQQLSSGMRVNSAKDDAAGLAIATRMSADIGSRNVVRRGLSDGISLTQIADGGLARIHEVLQRSRELAVQSLNDSLTPADRNTLNLEYQSLLAQIDTIANGTVAFGRYPLRGPQEVGLTPKLSDVFSNGQTRVAMASGIRPVAFIPKGATGVQIDIDSYGADDDLQLFTQSGLHLVGTPLGDPAWSNNGINSAADMASRTLLASYGFSPSASYDPSALVSGATAFTNVGGQPASLPLALQQSALGMNIGYSGDGDAQDGTPNNGLVAAGSTLERILIDQATEPLLLMVVGSGVFSATVSWTLMPTMPDPPIPGYGSIELTIDAGVNQTPQSLSLDPVPADSVSLGLSASGIGNPDQARDAMQALSNAIDLVSQKRTTVAAMSNRFESIIGVQSITEEHEQAARSRIMDADYAASTAALSQADILGNASQALLAQANTSPRLAIGVLLDSTRLR